MTSQRWAVVFGLSSVALLWVCFMLINRSVAAPISCAATHDDLAGIRALLYRGMEDDAFIEMPEAQFDKLVPARDFLWSATNQVEHLWNISRPAGSPEIPRQAEEEK